MQKFWETVTKLVQLPWVILLFVPLVIYTQKPIHNTSIVSFVFFAAIFSVFIIFPLGLAVLTKIFFFKNRPKPQQDTHRWKRYHTSTFPSMHTIVATAITIMARGGSLLEIIPQRLCWCYFVIAVLVMISRVKLKQHYRKDIIFGVVYTIVGMGVLTFIIMMIPSNAVVKTKYALPHPDQHRKTPIHHTASAFIP